MCILSCVCDDYPRLCFFSPATLFQLLGVSDLQELFKKHMPAMLDQMAAQLPPDQRDAIMQTMKGLGGEGRVNVAAHAAQNRSK